MGQSFWDTEPSQAKNITFSIFFWILKSMYMQDNFLARNFFLYPIFCQLWPVMMREWLCPHNFRIEVICCLLLPLGYIELWMKRNLALTPMTLDERSWWKFNGVPKTAQLLLTSCSWVWLGLTTLAEPNFSTASFVIRPFSLRKWQQNGDTACISVVENWFSDCRF